jgi:hypothetical protein
LAIIKGQTPPVWTHGSGTHAVEHLIGTRTARPAGV